MMTRAIRTNTEYTRSQVLRHVPEFQIENSHIEHIEYDRTIQTGVGWNVRMILNAVESEGDV